MNRPDGHETALADALPQIERLGEGRLRIRAAAKINLNLLVGPRRRDGFHTLDSYVCRVTFYDELDLRKRDDGTVVFSSRGVGCGEDEKNLACLAAKSFREASGGGVGGVEITLTKRIPPERGLGGGSSDAAAVLIGLNELWRTGKSPQELADLAGRLSSDAPLFLGPPAARMRGRGERVEGAHVHPFHAVLCMPEFGCSTSEVYSACDRRPHVAVEQLDAGVLADEAPSRWRGKLVNQLAEPACQLRPQLGQLRGRLSEATGLPVCLTGSGSAFFALCDDLEEAGRARAKLPDDLRRSCMIVRQNPW